MSSVRLHPQIRRYLLGTCCWLVHTVGALANSLAFFENPPNPPLNYDYGRQTALPLGFGAAEFTFEVWIKPDNSYPVGSIGTTINRQKNWTDADTAPYSSSSWWFTGNFLLDGHNNGSALFQNGTFSLQFYGGGRVRWLFGDGASGGLNGSVWAVEAYPAASANSLLDGQWHQITLVRRWSGVSSAQLELWVDGVLIDTETSTARTNMATTYWNSWTGFPSGQEGWFWGAEKQAAIGTLQQYEDYKGLIDEIRFWNRAKSPTEITTGFSLPVTGTETGLAGVLHLEEASGTSACDSLNPSQCMDLTNLQGGTHSAENAPLGAPTPTPTATPTPTPTASPSPSPTPEFNAVRTWRLFRD